MNERIDIPAELYEDEVVCFFAARYHTSTENVVRCFENVINDGFIGCRGMDGIVESLCSIYLAV